MRRGLNRIECGCVLVVFGILALLLIPGIQKVRSAATRLSCQNNLKQFGNAVHSYNDAYTHFPTGTAPNPTVPPEQRLSFYTTLCPFLESSPRYFAKEDMWGSPGSIATMEVWGKAKCFHCPQWQSSHGPLPTGHLAVTNYVGVAGVGADAAMRPEGAPGIGFFGYDRKLKEADVKDGLENTAMIFETGRDVGPWIRGGPSTVRTVDMDDVPPVGVDRPFGGTHKTFCVVLLANGSVRIMRSTGNPELLAALATIAGGEAITADW